MSVVLNYSLIYDYFWKEIHLLFDMVCLLSFLCIIHFFFFLYIQKEKVPTMTISSNEPAEIAPITTPRLEWEDARVLQTP